MFDVDATRDPEYPNSTDQYLNMELACADKFNVGGPRAPVTTY